MKLLNKFLLTTGTCLSLVPALTIASCANEDPTKVILKDFQHKKENEYTTLTLTFNSNIKDCKIQDLAPTIKISNNIVRIQFYNNDFNLTIVVINIYETQNTYYYNSTTKTVTEIK